MPSVARVTEISAISEDSFDDAIKVGVARASETLRGLQSAVVKDQEVQLGPRGAIVGYRVNLVVTFLLDGQYTGELGAYLDPATQTADFAALERDGL
jgi:dodecin